MPNFRDFSIWCQELDCVTSDSVEKEIHNGHSENTYKIFILKAKKDNVFIKV